MAASPSYFHQQLRPLYFFLIVAFSIVACSIWGLKSFSSFQLSELVAGKLPVVEKQLRYSEDRQQLISLLDTLNELQTTEVAIEKHQEAQALLKKVQREHYQLKVPYIFETTEAQQIIRVESNDVRNHHLIEKGLMVIEDLNQLLTNQLTGKYRQVTELSELLENDNVTDRVTASRSQSYARLSTEAHSLAIIQEKLGHISQNLKDLSLQTRQADLQLLTEQVDELLAWFEEQQAFITRESPELLTAFMELENIFLSEDRLIAKWRGHLRLYHGFQTLVEQQIAAINNYQPNFERESASVNDWLPALLSDWLKIRKIELKPEWVVWSLYSGVGAGSLIFLILLLSIARKAKAEVSQQAYLLKQYQDKQPAPESFSSANMQDMWQQLQALSLPKHSEREYQNLVKEIANEHQSLQQHHRLAFWQLATEENKGDLLALSELLSTPSDQLFSVLTWQSKKALVKLNKQPKQSVPVSIQAVTKSEHLIDLVVTANSPWQGSALVSDLLPEPEEVVVEVEAPKNNDGVELANAFNNKVHKAILQSQAETLTGKLVNLNQYRQLEKLAEFSQGKVLSEQLSSGQYQALLQDFVWQERMAIALSQFSSERSKNVLHWHDEITQPLPVFADTQLFDTLLSTLTRINLDGQQGNEFTLTTSVLEQDKSSYKLKYHFQLSHKNERGYALMEQVAQLKPCSEDKAKLAALLGEKLHISDLALERLGEGYQFSLVISHPISEKIQLDPPENLAQHNILVLGDSDATSYLCQSLINAKANIASAIDLQECEAKLAQQNISAIVAIASNMQQQSELVKLCKSIPILWLTDLQTSLAAKRKLFKIADAQVSYAPLTLSPLNKFALVAQLQTLIKNKVEGQTSAFVSAQYRFTNIEVLVASNDIRKLSQTSQHCLALGLKVKQAHTQQDMIQAWQTGRYLVLFSDFELPDIILDNGKDVSRTLFINKSTDSSISKVWQTYQWPESDSRFITEKLSPYLRKIKPAVAEDIVVKTPEPKATCAHDLFDELEPAFDLQTYAKHFVNAEQAVFMLAEHLKENHQIIKRLVYAISVKSSEHTLEEAALLKQQAKLFGDTELLLTIDDLESAIAEQDFNEAKSQAVKAAQTIELIAHYAEAI